jgi:hypothetical protein
VPQPSPLEPFVTRLERAGIAYMVTALAHRRMVSVDGLQLSLAPIEYVILRKLEYFREGQSQKHVRDIRGILAVSSELLDRSFLESWIARLGLHAAWQSVVQGA